MKRLLLSVSAVFMFSCSQLENPTLFERVTDTGIAFNNKVKDGELENSFYFRNFYNGGGVATGDINNDSLPDVFLTSNMGENKLYLNRGGLKFEDISGKAGLRQDSMWSTGVVMVDVNADGWLDIYECNSGHMQNGLRKNKLYVNQHNATFREEAATYGLDISGYCTQSSFFDYDLDGDLDMFLISNSPMPINSLGYINRRDLRDADWPVASFLKGGGDHLYRNDGGKFVEVSSEAGIHGTLMSFGLGVTVGDVNNDGYPDVYVANDSYERDYLYINQGNGTFKDDIENCVGQNSFSSMGADLSDVNNDGHPDIFTTDMLPADDYRLKTLGAFDNVDLHRQRLKTGLYNQYMKNCLMVNNGAGQFLETAYFSGVSATDWSWGALFFDADSDGLADIFVCNGVNKDVTNLDFMDFFANDIMQKVVESGQKESVDSVLSHIPITPIANAAFRNNGGLRFTDAAEQWGLAEPSFSNGAAYADLDNDGDLDLLVNNENQEAFVYRNNARQLYEHHYISFQLKGDTLNPFAVGAKVFVHKGKEVFYRELIPSRGFQSSMEYKQTVGLGTNASVDSVVVFWPDRTKTRLQAPAVDKLHHVSKGGSVEAQAYATESPVVPLLEVVAMPFDKHTEDDYVDFYYERNLPLMLSREGPHVAKGDVNGDGLEDLYIGGAKDQGGQLYLQSAKGSFAKSEQEVFKRFKDIEDAAVLFFDADKDKDLDLFIGPGGNNALPGQREVQHRLYKNDGKGNFALDGLAFPDNRMNISVAAAHDFDGDGDQDLFAGARSVPYAYGQPPVSCLYRNDGQGHFKEVAVPAVTNAGMVTSAVWVDVTGDAAKELVVVGEWTPPKIFAYRAGTFEPAVNTGLENLYGWWQTVSAADLNGDGKQDLVIGNVGENFYLRPNASAPVKLWLADFDGSGTPENFLTRTVNGKDVPVFLKREIVDQFPSLKKDNLKHADYATKTVQQLFGDELLSKAKVLTFNYCSSVVAINNGKGGFAVKPLPLFTQLSNISAVCATDVNNDGKPDLILGGNRFTFLPQFGRLDASYGHLLFNDGKGNFAYVENKRSGINLRGEIRDIEEVKMPTGRGYVIAQNDSVPVFYRYRK